MTRALYPVFLDLSGLPVVVVGGLAAEMPTPRRETYEARCRAHHELP